MQRTLFARVGAFLMLLVISLSSVQAQGTTAVRFVNVVPGLGDIDIYVNETLTVTALGYGAATTYINAPAGTLNLRVTLTGLTSTLWEQPVAVPEDEHLSLVAASNEPLNFTSYRDDLTPLAPGTGRLMVIHGIASGEAVDFLVEGDVIVGDLAPGAFINSIDVPANVYDIAVVPTGEDVESAILPETTISLQSLTTQTLVVFGTPASASVLTLKTATDGSDETGLVRITHGVADAPGVNVLLNDTALIPNLTYGESTEHLAIPAGSYTVKLQDAESGDDIASASLDVEAGAAITAVALSADDEVTLSVLEDAVDEVTPDTVAISVISTTGEAAIITLSDGTELEVSGTNAATATFEPASSVLTVTSGENETTTNTVFYGGVYYNIFVLDDGSLAIAPTSINQSIASAPGSELVEVVSTPEEPVATEEIIAEAPTATPEVAEALPTVTPLAEVAAPTTAPTNTTPTARIVLDPGANLHLREYPSAQAKSLGLAASGTILIVNGREGAPVDINGVEIPLSDGTSFVDLAKLLTPEEDLLPEETWLNVTYNTPDGGSITAWVNALYLDVDDPRGLRQRLADLPAVPNNRPGAASDTAISSPVEQEEVVQAIVTQLDTGVNLNIRRTAQIDGEVLARAASGTELDLVGLGSSGEWAFVRFYPIDGGSITGWVSTAYLRYEFRGETIDPDEMDARGLLEPVDEIGLRGEVNATGDSSASQSAFRDVFVATVIDLDEGISLNIRRTPDVNGEVIANVPSGEQMEIFSRDLSNQWLEVEFDGVRGWVFVQYVSISFNQTSADIESIPFNSDQLSGVAGNTPTPTFTPAETPTSTPEQ